jgi:hypothetical protein
MELKFKRLSDGLGVGSVVEYLPSIRKTLGSILRRKGKRVRERERK